MSSYYHRTQMKKTLAIMVVGCLLLASCSKITEEEEEWGETGTVSLGLCWLIVSGAGITYEPINLDKAFRREDLPVKFEFKERNDMDSICMQGLIIELIRIEEL